MTTLSCLGGWCHQRDKCKHHQTEDRSRPVERLCEVGTVDAFEPIRFEAHVSEQLLEFYKTNGALK